MPTPLAKQVKIIEDLMGEHPECKLELADVRSTLMLMIRYEDKLRDQFRIWMDRERAADAIETHPAVRAVKDAFPGATVADVRDLPK